MWMELIGVNLKSKPLYQTLETPWNVSMVRSWSNSTICGISQTCIFYLSWFKKYWYCHNLYSDKLYQVINSETIDLITPYVNYSFEVAPEKSTSSMPGLVFMWLEGIVTTTVSQSFMIPILTPCDLCVGNDLITMSGMVLYEQQYFSHWNLSIGMGYQWWCL